MWNPGTRILLHCIWGKFGEFLADSGARSILGLFNEPVSFFSTVTCIPHASCRPLTPESTRISSNCLQGKLKHVQQVSCMMNFHLTVILIIRQLPINIATINCMLEEFNLSTPQTFSESWQVFLFYMCCWRKIAPSSKVCNIVFKPLLSFDYELTVLFFTCYICLF